MLETASFSVCSERGGAWRRPSPENQKLKIICTKVSYNPAAGVQMAEMLPTSPTWNAVDLPRFQIFGRVDRAASTVGLTELVAYHEYHAYITS